MTLSLNTQVNIVEIDNEQNYGKFIISPLERGYGTTLGNSLRRVLLSSLPGTAISSIRFSEGVMHEFSTVKGVVEDVSEIILNLKGVALRSKVDDENLETFMRLDVEGPKIITAGDIADTTEVEVVNRDHYICTVNSEGKVNLELSVVSGRGYSLADQHKDETQPIGTIAIDSSFTPVEKVNYSVENTRVGQITDYDKLILEVWTNGTITPQEAVSFGSEILIEHLEHFLGLPDMELYREEEQEIVESTDDREDDLLLSKPIEELQLSLRSYNCLKKVGISNVGEILEKTEEELSGIKNFGQKSINEVKDKLKEWGLSLDNDLEY